jgi:hypothetical protein
MSEGAGLSMDSIVLGVARGYKQKHGICINLFFSYIRIEEIGCLIYKMKCFIQCDTEIKLEKVCPEF